MRTWIVDNHPTSLVGEWLAEHLEAAGHETFRSGWDPVERDRSEWVSVFRSSDADVLVYAAEHAGAYGCRRDPVRAAALNAGAPAIVAQACAEAGVRFVYLSSSEAAAGADLYGITKLGGEQTATLFAPGCQLIRLWGVYGSGGVPGTAREDLPTPTRLLVRALDREVPIYAHREVLRSWCHVTDAVRAIRMIIEDGRSGLWNVGSRDADISMFDLAVEACFAVGASAHRVTAAPGDPRVPKTKVPDTTAVLSLGWEPRKPLADGLRETAAWLRSAGHAGGKAAALPAGGTPAREQLR